MFAIFWHPDEGDMVTQSRLALVKFAESASFLSATNMALYVATWIFKKSTPFICVTTQKGRHKRGAVLNGDGVLQNFSRIEVIWWPDLGHSFFHSKNQVTNALVCQSSKPTEIHRFHWIDELLGRYHCWTLIWGEINLGNLTPPSSCLAPWPIIWGQDFGYGTSDFPTPVGAGLSENGKCDWLSDRGNC